VKEAVEHHLVLVRDPYQAHFGQGGSTVQDDEQPVMEPAQLVLNESIRQAIIPAGAVPRQWLSASPAGCTQRVFQPRLARIAACLDAPPTFTDSESPTGRHAWNYVSYLRVYDKTILLIVPSDERSEDRPARVAIDSPAHTLDPRA
jgi:hypothetical protein